MNININLENTPISFKKFILLLLNELKYYFIILNVVLYSKNTALYNNQLYIDIILSWNFYVILMKKLLQKLNDNIFITKLNNRSELINIKNYNIIDKINLELDIKNFITNLEKNNKINNLVLKNGNTKDNVSKEIRIFETRSLHKITEKYTEYLEYIIKKNNTDQLFCLIKYIINKDHLLLKYIIKKKLDNNSSISNQNKDKFNKIVVSNENKDKFNIFEKSLNNSRKIVSIDIIDKIDRLKNIFEDLEKINNNISYNDYLKNLSKNKNINLEGSSDSFKKLISLLLHELQYYFIILTAIFNDKNNDKNLYNNLLYTDVIMQWDFYQILIKKILEKIDNRVFIKKLDDKKDELENITVCKFNDKINLTVKLNKSNKKTNNQPKGKPNIITESLSGISKGAAFAGGGK